VTPAEQSKALALLRRWFQLRMRVGEERDMLNRETREFLNFDEEPRVTLAGNLDDRLADCPMRLPNTPKG
jgi:hypothetical protein